MNFFILIWVAVTVFLLSFWGWSIVVLYKQKQSWKQFAKNRGLRYRSNSVFDSPEITGALKDYKVYIFTAEHEASDGRYARRLTSIEVSLKSALPVSVAVASGGMVKIVEDLNFHVEYRPDLHGWDNSYIVRSRNEAVAREYLTERRLQEVVKLMKLKNSWVILFFSSGQGLLRIDTPDPLNDIKKIDSYVSKMLQAAQVLELEKGEKEKLAYKAEQKEIKGGAGSVSRTPEIPDDLLEGPIGLTLEEDDD
ncbi:MAG: hypothetical protein KDI61_02665 [Alphaproteobacteria bacterium]|nr:hypothetical protein [Alphaproteobacteria bacterium]MCB1839152.1 hypothetical protein [Alphaproteobacteria bacterium]